MPTRPRPPTTLTLSPKTEPGFAADLETWTRKARVERGLALRQRNMPFPERAGRVGFLYDQIERTVAEKAQAVLGTDPRFHFVDFHGGQRDLPPEPRFYLDHVHPSPEGNAWVAKRYFEVIKTALSH